MSTFNLRLSSNIIRLVSGLAILSMSINYQAAAIDNISTAKDSSIETQTGASSSLQSQNVATFQVYKDPATGEFSPPPTENFPPELSEQLRNYLSTSSDGLEEINIGNGYMVDLQNRFQEVVIFSTGDFNKITAIKE